MAKDIVSVVRAMPKKGFEDSSSMRECALRVWGANSLRFGSILEPSWRLDRRLGAVLRPSWGRLGAVLAPSWAVLAETWAC